MKNLLALTVSVLISYLSYSQAANDACAGAITIPVSGNPTLVAGDLYNAQNSTTTGTGNCGTKKDVWFRFTVPAQSTFVKVTASLTSPTSLQTSTTFFELVTDGACPTIVSRNTGCLNIGSTRYYTGLTAGTSYLLRVYSTEASLTSGGTNNYKFNISVTSNDNQINPALVEPGTSNDGTVVGASTSSGAPVNCATGNPDDDVWFSFTAQLTYHEIMLSSIGSGMTSTANGARIQLFRDVSGTLTTVACGTHTIHATGLTGGLYKVRVYSAQTGAVSNGGFNISVFPSAPQKVVGGRMNEVYDQQILSSPQVLYDPWEVIYGPDGNLWITESKGYKVYKVNPVTGIRDTILDISQGSTFLPAGDQPFNCQFGNGSGAQGGLAGMVLHPKFLDATAPVNWVYIAYVHSQQTANNFTNRVVRFNYNTSTGKLESPISVCDTLPGSNDHNSQRITIAPVGSKYYLFYAEGDMGAGQFGNVSRTNKAQLTNSYEGKILRFNLEPDGDAGARDQWIPSGALVDEYNPYSAALGVQSAVWSVGIRNNQGFAWDPVKKKMYGSSHGPFSDDEINVIERGRNYGHPLVIGFADGNANGTTAGASPNMSPPHPSSCPVITDEVAQALALPGYKDPFFSAYPSSTVFPSLKNLWDVTAGANGLWPSESWSGLDFYSGTAIPGWNRSLIAASLKWGRLVRIKSDTSGEKSATASVNDTISYFGSTNRFRDLAFTPDGKDIYVVMDRSLSTSGPSAANPIVTACQGCLQKYTFLGYYNNSGRSTLPTTIQASEGAANTCNIATSVGINSSNYMLWVPVTGPDGNFVAEIFSNGQNLGNITASFYQHQGGTRSACTGKYLNRSITITPQTQPTNPVRVRLYIRKKDFDSLDADALSQITTLADLKVYKNNNPCQSYFAVPGTIFNPVYAEAHRESTYVIAVDIPSFSTFYFAAANITLPHDLNFSGIFRNQSTHLTWKTENEVNTDRYIVERSIGNSVYEAIGTVAAKGATGTKANYGFEDKSADMPPRKCSREECPSRNVKVDRTVKCHRCNGPIHLPCYGIDKSATDIFVIPNIVMICDVCLETDYSEPSPKRKPTMVQRTLSSNLELTTPNTKLPVVESPIFKSLSNNTVESLSMELKVQTATIAALKTSVDEMHGTIKRQQTENDQKLVERSDGQMSTIKNTINEATKSLIETIKKPTYAHVVKRQSGLSQSGTPRSLKNDRVNEPNKQAQSGTSSINFGKPPSPFQPRQIRQQRAPRTVSEKAVWVSKMHRDLSEDELLAYVKDDLGIQDDQLVVRKLVKKDRDISTYSFVSFCIMCSANTFGSLMDVNKWPSYSQIREFELDSIHSVPCTVPEFNRKNSKNAQQTPTEPQQLPEETSMEIMQIPSALIEI